MVKQMSQKPAIALANKWFESVSQLIAKEFFGRHVSVTCFELGEKHRHSYSNHSTSVTIMAIDSWIKMVIGNWISTNSKWQTFQHFMFIRKHLLEIEMKWKLIAVYISIDSFQAEHLKKEKKDGQRLCKCQILKQKKSKSNKCCLYRYQ